MSITTFTPVKVFALACVGFFIRYSLITLFKDVVSPRVEVTTPINSWRRAYEAVYLWNSGSDPYSASTFHEYPISLQFYKFIITYFSTDIVFAITDVITAILLQQSTSNQLTIAGETKSEASTRGMKVLLAYLFSPIAIISCVGTSTSIFTNFLIALINFILPLKPFRILTCVLCALLACNNIHNAALILPMLLCLEYCHKKQHYDTRTDKHSTYYQRQDFRRSLTISFSICIVSCATAISVSYILMGNTWTFLKSTFLFVLKVEDLTPNIGMLWYFFTEMFEQFLDFFTWVVQINSFIHVIPLSILLRDSPFFALYAVIITTTISQPYPSLSNIALITSLLPQWSELFPHMKRLFVVFWSGLACMSLWPVFWHLWIIMGTANSNFYFGATLAFSVTLIIFLVDLLNAHGFLKAKLRYKQTKTDK